MERKFRKNHLELSFERKPERPSCIEILDWMDKEIGLVPEMFNGIQFDSIRNSVFLQFFSEEETLRAYRKLDRELIFTTEKGTKIQVIVKKCDEFEKKIRILNLPMDMPEDIIRNALNKYGTVLNITDERWGKNVKYSNIKTGVRIVSVNLKIHIPSYIDILGYRAFTSYDGQIKTCSICNSGDHLRSECPKTKIANMRLWKLNNGDQNQNRGPTPHPVASIWPALPMVMTTMNRTSEANKNKEQPNHMVIPETQNNEEELEEECNTTEDTEIINVIPETQEIVTSFPNSTVLENPSSESLTDVSAIQVDISTIVSDEHNIVADEEVIIENTSSTQDINLGSSMTSRPHRSRSRNNNKPYNVGRRNKSKKQ